MKNIYTLVAVCVCICALSSCSTYRPSQGGTNVAQSAPSADYASRIPSKIAMKGKTIVVDPSTHVWGAYDADGNLVRAGLATAGGKWCSDIGRSCRTPTGTFRIYSLGNASCKSTRYPVGKGGAPMPYCMFYDGNHSLHGSSEVIEANVSHGCVRLRVPDAEWMRYNFATVGTRVVIKSY